MSNNTDENGIITVKGIHCKVGWERLEGEGRR